MICQQLYSSTDIFQYFNEKVLSLNLPLLIIKLSKNKQNLTILKTPLLVLLKILILIIMVIIALLSSMAQLTVVASHPREKFVKFPNDYFRKNFWSTTIQQSIVASHPWEKNFKFPNDYFRKKILKYYKMFKPTCDIQPS